MGFKEAAGLDDKLLNELYGAFIKEINKLKEDINDNLKQENLEALRKDIHNIMGLSSNYRANKVYEIARKVNLKQKESSVKYLQYYYQSLSEVIDESIEIIQNYLKSL